MQSYVALKPKDADGFRELAALYLQQATEAQERGQIYQARSGLPRAGFRPQHHLPARRRA